MDTLVMFIETQSGHKDLVRSLNILDIPYVRLMENEEWPGHFGALQIYVDALKKTNNEWVLLTDARDVLFYKDLKQINETYYNYYFDYDIIVQAEDTPGGCIHFRKLKLPRYSFSDTYYKYPCAGLVMGRRNSIIDFYEDVIDNVPSPWDITDQSAIEWGMANLSHNIGLDTECRLFQQMGMEDFSGMNYHLHFTKDFIKNEHTQTEPCIFHGAGKSFLQPVWKIINGLY